MCMGDDMPIDYLKQSRTFYKEKFLTDFGQPVGCSEVELSVYENCHGLVFPSAYRQFLLWMGNDLRGILRGSDWFLKNIQENTECLSEFLTDNSVAIDFAKHPLCFFMHQGYMAAWFYLDQGEDDPACFFFSEATEERAIVRYKYFSDFLFREIGSQV